MSNTINTCYIFVPGLSDKFRSGGLMVIQDVAEIFRDLGIRVQFVATHEMHPDCITPTRAFEEAHKEKNLNSVLFLTTWGPLAEKHIKLIQQNIAPARIVHYAQSFGWGVHIPKGIPIVCVSRYVMAQFALNTSGHPLFVISPFLHEPFSFSDEPREIDVLVHTRKQSMYCLNHLLPSLKHSLVVETIDSWIPQDVFAALLKKSKVFLYVTEHHKAGLFKRLPGEGFGLPALEAVASGTIVASNLLGGVTDFLTPRENCIPIQEDLIHDASLIQLITKHFSPNKEEAEKVGEAYGRERIKRYWKNFLG